jgi:hypothetical protein
MKRLLGLAKEDVLGKKDKRYIYSHMEIVMDAVAYVAQNSDNVVLSACTNQWGKRQTFHK